MVLSSSWILLSNALIHSYFTSDLHRSSSSSSSGSSSGGGGGGGSSSHPYFQAINTIPLSSQLSLVEYQLYQLANDDHRWVCYYHSDCFIHSLIHWFTHWFIHSFFLYYHRAKDLQSHHHNASLKGNDRPSYSKSHVQYGADNAVSSKESVSRSDKTTSSHIFCDSIIDDRYSLFIQYSNRNNNNQGNNSNNSDMHYSGTGDFSSPSYLNSSICSSINTYGVDNAVSSSDTSTSSSINTKHQSSATNTHSHHHSPPPPPPHHHHHHHKQQQQLDDQSIIRIITTVLLSNLNHTNSHVHHLNHTKHAPMRRIERVILYNKARSQISLLLCCADDDNNDNKNDNNDDDDDDDDSDESMLVHWTIGLSDSFLVVGYNMLSSTDHNQSSTDHRFLLFELHLAKKYYVIAQRRQAIITLSESLFVGENVMKHHDDDDDDDDNNDRYNNYHQYNNYENSEVLQNLFICQQLKPLFSEEFHPFLTHNKGSMKYKPYVSEDLSHWMGVCGFRAPIAHIGSLPTTASTTTESYCNLLKIEEGIVVGVDVVRKQVSSPSSSSPSSLSPSSPSSHPSSSSSSRSVAIEELIDVASYVCLEDFLSTLHLLVQPIKQQCHHHHHHHQSTINQLSSVTYISSLGLHSFLKSFSIVDHNQSFANYSSADYLSFQSLITVLRALPGSSLDHLIITSIYDTSYSVSTHRGYNDSDVHSDCNNGSDSRSDSANQNQLSSSADQQPIDGDNSSDQCDEVGDDDDDDDDDDDNDDDDDDDDDEDDDRRSSSRSVEQRLIESMCTHCDIEFHDDYSSIKDVLQQTM